MKFDVHGPEALIDCKAPGQPPKLNETRGVAQYRCCKPYAAAFRSSNALLPMLTYADERVANATCIAIEIVSEPTDQAGFAVHLRRWVVERCFAWLG